MAGTDTQSGTSASTLGPLSARLVATPLGPVEAAVAGAGPPLIVVHGTGGSWRQSIPLAEDFADRHTVILVSRPGYGATPLASGPTLETQARAYAGLLDTLGLGPAVILGISGGGPAALAFAALAPEACLGLLLCCAVAPPLPRATPLAWLAASPLFVRAYASARVARLRRALADPAVAAHFLDDRLTELERAAIAAEPERGRDIEDFLRRTVEAPLGLAGLAQDARAARRGWSVSPDAVDALRAPTLILHGSADAVVPYSHALRHAAQIRAARLETIAGAGHLFLLALRRESRERIGRFLAAL